MESNLEQAKHSPWASSLTAEAVKPEINEPCHGYTGGVVTQNGHVTPHPEVFLIYWDAYFTSTPAAVNSMNLLVWDLVEGTYIKGLAQYGIGRGTVMGFAVIDMTTYPAPASLTEAQLQTQLIQWFNDGIVSLPSLNEVNRVYLIVAPSATSLSLNGQTGGFCGYHQHGKYNKSSGDDNIFWGVVQGFTQSSDGKGFVDSISYCVSHELSEAFSNRDGQGVISSNGCEVGDICESDGQGCCTTVPYLGWQIERYWSQSDNKCYTAGGALEHTIRFVENGNWQTFWGDVAAQIAQGPNINPIQRTACASDGDGNLQVCALDQNGKLWHTIRFVEDGSWQLFWGDVAAQIAQGPDIQPLDQVACASDEDGDLHVCVLDHNGKLWHTIRFVEDGSWQTFWGDVAAQIVDGPDIGPLQRIACASDEDGNLHVCVLDRNGMLWHTIRFVEDGSWQPFWGDIQSQLPQGPDIRPISQIACAANEDGDLHVCTLDQYGMPWHTIRFADDGSWQPFWGDVQSQLPQGPDIRPVSQIACASDEDGNLQVCALDQNGTLWHTIRFVEDGSWQPFWGDVEFQIPQGPDIRPIVQIACASDEDGNLQICAIS